MGSNEICQEKKIDKKQIGENFENIFWFLKSTIINYGENLASPGFLRKWKGVWESPKEIENKH